MKKTLLAVLKVAAGAVACFGAGFTSRLAIERIKNKTITLEADEYYEFEENEDDSSDNN